MDRYIMEIAGKDSVASLLLFASKNPDIEIIPTIAITGTEYGQLDSYKEILDFLRKRLEDFHVVLGNIIYVQNNRLWNYMNARYQYYIYKKYMFYTPCITCHLYAHLLRIAVYKKCGAQGIITGERESHSGKIKINQHYKTLEIFDKIFKEVGIKFIRPLQKVYDTREVDSLINTQKIIEHANDVKCVMEGNLQGFFDKEENQVMLLEKYLDDFVLPFGIFCAKCFDSGDNIDMKKLDQMLKGILDV